MSHSYSSNLFHCVFSTKERRECIAEDLQPQLWAYIGGVARNHGFRALAVGGTSNHAHLLLSLPPTVPVAKALQLIKAASSKWMHEEAAQPGFAWQEGYGAFSIGIAQVESTMAYIGRQTEHHRKRDFHAEFIAFLNKHGIEYDPRYVLG